MDRGCVVNVALIFGFSYTMLKHHFIFNIERKDLCDEEHQCGRCRSNKLLLTLHGGASNYSLSNAPATLSWLAPAGALVNG
jgi:hypothetical protein